MPYTRNSKVVAELVKVSNDCTRLKEDFEHIIHNVRNKDDVEIVQRHILLIFDELLKNEVREKIDAMEKDKAREKIG